MTLRVRIVGNEDLRVVRRQRGWCLDANADVRVTPMFAVLWTVLSLGRVRKGVVLLNVIHEHWLRDNDHLRRFAILDKQYEQTILLWRGG